LNSSAPELLSTAYISINIISWQSVVLVEGICHDCMESIVNNSICMKRKINSDGQFNFNWYQQNEQHPLTSYHWTQGYWDPYSMQC